MPSHKSDDFRTTLVILFEQERRRLDATQRHSRLKAPECVIGDGIAPTDGKACRNSTSGRGGIDQTLQLGSAFFCATHREARAAHHRCRQAVHRCNGCADRLSGTAPRWHHRCLDLKPREELCYQRTRIAKSRLSDVRWRPERKHGACTVGEGSERDRFRGKFSAGLIVVGDADRKFATIRDRRDCRVESSVAVRAQTAGTRDLRAGECRGHCRG